MTSANNRSFLSVAGLADELNVPISSVRYWIATGTAPRSFKIGRHRRFLREDIETWLAARADDPRPAA